MLVRTSVSRFACVLSFLLVFCVAAQPCLAQGPYETQELKRHFQTVAESYQMTAGSTPLQLRPQPLLAWDNSERENLHGALYAWSRNGRPQVLGSIFTYDYAGRTWCRHEMLSLADQPVTATLDSEVVWHPPSSGLKWKELNDAPEPHDSAAKRLFQMRTLSRRFSGTLSITDKPVSKLRLVSQPLMRYQCESEGVIDAAIFSFAVATDAEILLLIEARRSTEGADEYFFAAAPGHYHALQLNLDEKSVWSVPRKIELESTLAGQQPWAREPFFIFTPRNPLP